jgi:hypothetical protein
VARTPVLVLDNQLLRGLAYNDKAVALLPALAKVRAQGAGQTAKRKCGFCGKGLSGEERALGEAKRQVSGLADTRLEALKAFLNADKLRVSIDGRTVTR